MNRHKEFVESLRNPMDRDQPVEDLAVFTPHAQRLIELASEEAARLNHNFVGTEHLLLGVIKLDQGVAVNVLQKLGLQLDALRLEVEKCLGKGPDQKILGPIPYTPRVKRVLALAIKESRALNHTYVGTEHILLGLLREGDGVAARMLANRQVDVETSRREILKELDPNFGTEVGPPWEQQRKEDPAPISDAESQMAAASANRALPRQDQTFSLTPRAQQALALARKEADRFNHAFVGSEHLLLGLISLGQGVAVAVLAKVGLGLESVRAEVEKQVGKHSSPHPKNINISYTPRVKRVLAAAAGEARALNHTYVGTEHLLIGLLTETDGVAAHIFKHFGVDCAKTRDEIMAEIAPEGDEPQPFQMTRTPTAYGRSDHPVDTTKRYDVYCTERDQLVVYRDVLFKAAILLPSGSPLDPFSRFIELEQRDGKTIFVSRASIVKFCEHDVAPGSEKLSGEKPNE